jgi:hypothetical protein
MTNYGFDRRPPGGLSWTHSALDDEESGWKGLQWTKDQWCEHKSVPPQHNLLSSGFAIPKKDAKDSDDADDKNDGGEKKVAV